jgi:hypothetical protein
MSLVLVAVEQGPGLLTVRGVLSYRFDDLLRDGMYPFSFFTGTIRNGCPVRRNSRPRSAC